MPLSPATPRKLLHQRDIQVRGYERADGLVDIEAHMTDTKTYSWGNQDRGGIQAGEPLHDMWVRITIDHDMMIHACEASMDATPYNVCPGAAPGMGQLAGLKIGKGFLRAAMHRIGGVAGCTHLRELLQPLATVAFQSMHGLRARTAAGIPTALLNTCFAYNETGPLANRPAAQSDANI
jgi:hypothetical protein